jgi:hypothetical protein
VPQAPRDERDLVYHQATDEVHIARRSSLATIPAAIQRVRALAALNLHKLAGDRVALLLSEPRDGFGLGFQAQAATTLPGRRDADVADDRFCRECAPGCYK